VIDGLDALEESRFSIERELGRGGTASVFLAHDRILDRSIALKVLHPSVAAAIGTDRFAREVKETARLVIRTSCRCSIPARSAVSTLR